MLQLLVEILHYWYVEFDFWKSFMNFLHFFFHAKSSIFILPHSFVLKGKSKLFL